MKKSKILSIITPFKKHRVPLHSTKLISTFDFGEKFETEAEKLLKFVQFSISERTHTAFSI